MAVNVSNVGQIKNEKHLLLKNRCFHKKKTELIETVPSIYILQYIRNLDHQILWR